MYPSGYQYALMEPLMQLISKQWRISNFLLLYSSGFSRYFWRMKVRADPSPLFSLPLSLSRISSKEWHTLMPCPLLLYSPGFTIQTFRQSFPRRLFSSSCEQQLKKSLYSGSSIPLTIWKVRGSASKTFICILLQYARILQKSAFLLPMQQFCSRWLCTTTLELSSMRCRVLEPRRAARLRQVRQFITTSFLLLRLRCYCQFCRSLLWKILPCSSSLSSSLMSIRMATVGSRMVEDGCCALKMLLTLSWVHIKWQPSGLSESAHQNLRLMRAFNIRELLPLPTQARQQTSSGCERTNSPHAKFAFHRKSRQASTLSLCFSWAPCFSPSPHTKGSFLPKRKRFMMQSSAGRETALLLRLQMRYLRFYLKNSRFGRRSVAIWVFVSRNFISRCVLESRICCLCMVASLRSSSSSFRMAISFCRMRQIEIVSSCSFYSLTFSPANLRLSSPSSGRSILSDLSLGIWTNFSLFSRETGSGLRGLSYLAVREREQSTMRLVWVTVRKEFFFLSSQLIRVQISLIQCRYAFFLL